MHVKSVVLDEIMKDPENPREDFVFELEIKVGNLKCVVLCTCVCMCVYVCMFSPRYQSVSERLSRTARESGPGGFSTVYPGQSPPTALVSVRNE